MFNKLIYRYLTIGIVFYVITLFCFQELMNYSFIEEGITDKYYCFQFVVYYLIGCSLIDKTFGYMSYTRMTNRKNIVTRHISLYVNMAFLHTSILYCIVIVDYLFLNHNMVRLELRQVWLDYMLLLLTTLCLSMLILLIRYSGKKGLRNYPQVIVYLIVLLEVMVYASFSEAEPLLPDKIVFTWMFYDKSFVNSIVLAGYTVLFLVVTIILTRQVDLD